MVAPEVQGIDLFKIANRSISGWVPSLKTAATIRQPFCSQLEERLLLWLEYHPQVQHYTRGDIGQAFATAYRLPLPKHAPFAIGYVFEDQPHDYLPDVVGTLTNGTRFIAEAGMEDDKRSDRNLAKAEAARRLARLQRGVFWIGTERTLTRQRHYNLVFVHARRKTFPAFADIAAAVHEGAPETKPQQETRRANGPQNTTQTVDAQVPPSTSPKCTFAGVVAIDLTRFADSGVALVECPACSRLRSLSPRKGVLRFPSHDRRKLQTTVTGVRWAAKGKTDWGVVGGETT